jgi:hypothetical protein
LWWSLLGGYDMVAMLVADRDLITRSWLKPRSRPYAPTLDTCTCVLSGCLHVLNLNSNDYESRQKTLQACKKVTRPRSSFRRDSFPIRFAVFARVVAFPSDGRSAGRVRFASGTWPGLVGMTFRRVLLSFALEFCVPGLCYLPVFLNRCVPCLSRLPRGVFEAVQLTN